MLALHPCLVAEGEGYRKMSILLPHLAH